MPEGAKREEDKLKGAQMQPLFIVGQSYCQLSGFVSPTQEPRPNPGWCGPPRQGDGPRKQQDVEGIINYDMAGSQWTIPIKVQIGPARVMLMLFQPFRHLPTQYSTFPWASHLVLL